MALHGSAYNTYDLDILYDRETENIAKIVQTLSQFSPQLRAPEGPIKFKFDERTIKNGLNFALQTTLGHLDLLGEIPGIGNYKSALKFSKIIKVNDCAIQVLTLEGLIRGKRASGRVKDKYVLPELEALNELEQKTKPT